MTTFPLQSYMLVRASKCGLLDLPESMRERIYRYLLQPHPEEATTTINYRLDWPHLGDPSNTTFAGLPQLDPCSCPRGDVTRRDSIPQPHFYTRHECSGPRVRFTPQHKDVWVLQEALGQFNILRPATTDELNHRPSSSILQASRQIYEEACPILYRDRNFLFLTGPCPRGRYQAYATLQWLKQLSPTARANVEVLSLLVQPYEEDCDAVNVEESYAELGLFICEQVPRFKWLCLEVWDETVYQAGRGFLRLVEKEGVSVVVRRQWRDDTTEVFASGESFVGSFDVVEE